MATRYRAEVVNLVDSLNHPEKRAESATLLRTLVDKIVLKPDPDGTGLLIDLYGDLAGILNVAATRNKPLKVNDYSPKQAKVVAGVRNLRGLLDVKQDEMVAGAGFEPATFRL